jgi:signal transduction histidine kinase
LHDLERWRDSTAELGFTTTYQTSRMAKGSGVGIAGMGERLSDLGGTLQIISDSNGTVLKPECDAILREWLQQSLDKQNAKPAIDDF